MPLLSSSSSTLPFISAHTPPSTVAHPGCHSGRCSAECPSSLLSSSSSFAMSLLNYFLLSDVNKNIKVKAVALKGRALPLAFGLTSPTPSFIPLDPSSSTPSTTSSPTPTPNPSPSPSSSLSPLSLYHSLACSKECELFLEAAIYSDGARIGTSSFTTYRRSTSLSASTLPSSLPSSTSPTPPYPSKELDQLKFSEWITFPVKYPDLLPSSKLVFTVWAVSHPQSTLCDTAPPTPPTPSTSSPIHSSSSPSPLPPSASPLSASTAFPLGGTCMPLFNGKGILKLGRRRLLLHLGVPGDGSLHSATPYKEGKSTGVPRLEQLIWQYDQKDLPCDVRWLDKLALHRIAALQMRETSHLPALSTLAAMSTLPVAQGGGAGGSGGVGGGGAAVKAAQAIHLIVEFPSFPHPLVYWEKTCNPPPPPLQPLSDKSRLFLLHDPELTRDNPVELKYHKLSRSSKGLKGRDLKPKITERRQLDRIISSPVPRLTPDERELVWKFRFSLLEDRRALTKFLRCVNWTDVGETGEALTLLTRWTAIDIAATLELLSSSFNQNDPVREYAVRQLERATNDEILAYLLQLVQALRYERNYPSPLSIFLIQRCTTSMQLCNFFFWYVKVEEGDPKQGAMFQQLMSEFLSELSSDSTSDERRSWHSALMLESKLMDDLRELNLLLHEHKRVERKIEKLRLLLSDSGSRRDLRHFPEVTRMAVRPDVLLTGMVGDDCTLFRSALAPMLLTFSTAANDKYRVLFKHGDDLRQDQLMIQMINLMDSLLKNVRLDLQLTPYRVLATSSVDGFVEFVPNCYTVATVLNQYSQDLRQFLAQHNTTPDRMLLAVERFVKSCAGYAVITYLLGIGDRHLDNIMLTTQGHLFHIDFGFIFGRDPKPLPPPIKITKEMVEAMGGAGSAHYKQFQQYAVSAFNILRQHASLILNLLSLMQDAGIPRVSDEMEKNLLKTQEKFRLELNDEEAGLYILSLIDQSVTALFPVMMERIHKWALYWK